MDGVVIVALGNPIYGNMAFNLAMSLKYTSNVDVCCLYSEQSLSELSVEQLTFFDKTICVNPKYYQKAYQRVKCFVNELTPYDRTIMIDADTVWNRDISPLFTDDFKIGCLGKWENGKETYDGYTYWYNPAEIVEYWGVNLLYKTYSGFVAFTKEHDYIWKEVQKVYDDKDAPCEEWNGDKPDEYAFNVGISLSGYKISDYMPVFFGYENKRYFEHGMRKYYGVSVSGAFPDPYIITVYNKMMKEYSYRVGVEHKKYIKKGIVLKERKKL